MSQEVSADDFKGLDASRGNYSKDSDMNQTVTVVVENKAGVLARVVGLIARRGFNISSLNVAPTDDPGLSRITFVYDKHSAPVEQVLSQINKLINVISIDAVDAHSAVEREMLMVSVHARATTRSEVVELTRIFDGRVVDVGQNAITLVLAGRPDKIDDFEELLRPYGILQMQRSGRIALPHLKKSNADQDSKTNIA